MALKKFAAPKDTKELREFLLDRMVAVANGEMGAVEARAVALLARQVNSTLMVEIAHAVGKARSGEVDSLRLGNE